MAVQDNLARKPIYIRATQPEGELYLRVAAYCRVSSDSDDQLNSFAAQQNHYYDYINSHDHWELAEIYADATVIIGLKQNPTIGRRFSPIFSFIEHLSGKYGRCYT